MCQKEIAGVVELPPEHQLLNSPARNAGGRSIPQTSLRLRCVDGQIILVTYMGELDGQVSVGDYLVARGFRRGPGIFRATEIWLRGRLNSDGELEELPRPVRVACKTVCVVASLLYGRESREVRVLTAWRDERLARSAVGRGFIGSYYACAPFLVYCVLMDHPGIQRVLSRGLSTFVEHLAARERG